MSFFEELYESTGREFPDPSGLGTPQKAALVQRMFSVGCKAKQIAEHMNLSVPRVYQLRKIEIEQDVTELENQTFLDSLMIQIRSIEDDIDEYKSIQGRILGSDDSTDRRPNREYLELGRLVKDLQKMVIDLKRIGGILPSVAGDMSIYSTLEDSKPTETDSTLIEKNSEELTNLLLDKLTGKTQSIRPKTLAEIKDDKVL